MSGTLAVVDVLNPREKALVLWLVAIVVFAAIEGDGVASSFLGASSVCYAEAAPPFGSAALYSAALVFLGKEADLWQASATKATVYWFFGTAVILVGRARQIAPDCAPVARQ